MTPEILAGTTGTYYALFLNGRIASPKYTNRVQAEMARSSLPAEQQRIAEVRTVDSSEREILLG